MNSTRPDCHLAELFPPADSLERLRLAYPGGGRLARHLTDPGTFSERLLPLPWPCWSARKPTGAISFFEERVSLHEPPAPWDPAAVKAQALAVTTALFNMEGAASLEKTRRNSFLAFREFEESVHAAEEQKRRAECWEHRQVVVDILDGLLEEVLMVATDELQETMLQIFCLFISLAWQVPNCTILGDDNI